MISIIMAYYNRRAQLLKTLKSIWHFGNPEIIIVDDASDETLFDIQNITLLRIEQYDKTWTNPSIPHNIGLSQANGDIIIIQNPECYHTGDILSYCKNLKKKQMFSFGAYSLDYDLPEDTEPELMRDHILTKEPQTINKGHHGWYNHSIHRPVGFHFCNAYKRSDMERIGGFDERFARGFAFDDNELLLRTQRAGIKINIIDDPFVIHQKHIRSDYRRYAIQREKNYILYQQCLTENYIKPPMNKNYGY